MYVSIRYGQRVTQLQPDALSLASYQSAMRVTSAAYPAQNQRLSNGEIWYPISTDHYILRGYPPSTEPAPGFRKKGGWYLFETKFV